MNFTYSRIDSIYAEFYLIVLSFLNIDFTLFLLFVIFQYKQCLSLHHIIEHWVKDKKVLQLMLSLNNCSFRSMKIVFKWYVFSYKFNSDFLPYKVLIYACLHVQELEESLRNGLNIPTVLQSLGCLAQHSVSTFETQNGEITQLIHEKIFQVIVLSLVWFC